MRTKGLQYFSDEYIKQCSKLTPDQIIEFIEDFQELMAQIPEKKKSVNLRIEPSLLADLKSRADFEGIPYQEVIRQLIRDWVYPKAQ
jgi:predicted DNA binding CopG/RHH family protein